MFKIEPIQDKTRQKEICKLCFAEFRPDFFAYYMYDMTSGEPMGMSQFEIGDGYGYISELLPAPGCDDYEAMFILGRQTMNFIDLCGAHFCMASTDAGESSLLKAIGFKSAEGDRLVSDMTGMFDGHCDGHTVNYN